MISIAIIRIHRNNNISIQSQRTSIINFIPIHPNIQESNTHQTENVIQSNRLFLLSPQCETYNVFGKNETTSRDLVSRDSISKDSISRDSVSRDLVLRDSVPRDSVPRDSVSRDSMPRDSTSRNSVSKDSTSRDLVSRDSISRDSISRYSTPSPALQTLPINTKIDRLNKIKNKSNTYLEHLLVALSDSLQQRMANEPSQQLAWNFNNLTPDKSFGL